MWPEETHKVAIRGKHLVHFCNDNGSQTTLYVYSMRTGKLEHTEPAVQESAGEFQWVHEETWLLPRL